MWGNGTIDGMKILFSSEELPRGSDLTYSYGFGAGINDIIRCPGANYDEFVLHNFHDGFGF